MGNGFANEIAGDVLICSLQIKHKIGGSFQPRVWWYQNLSRRVGRRNGSGSLLWHHQIREQSTDRVLLSPSPTPSSLHNEVVEGSLTIYSPGVQVTPVFYSLGKSLIFAYGIRRKFGTFAIYSINIKWFSRCCYVKKASSPQQPLSYYILTCCCKGRENLSLVEDEEEGGAGRAGCSSL